jgi:hypothetical protein
MGQSVTNRELCTTCVGTGSLYVPDPPIRRPKPTGRGGGGGRAKPGVPWGFKKKQPEPDDDTGIIHIDPEVPPTPEEKGRAAAAVIGMMAFAGVALYVGWVGTLWASLVPPVVGGGIVWLVLRSFPIATLRMIQLVLLGLLAGCAYYLANLFGLFGSGHTP